MIPAYLTLPPGKETAHGLPAIVMPHGGPAARDEWGFDFLAQYFAARGFAVIQPQFRGSAGFGDAWLVQNGFRSWRIAIGDVTAAGRWLVSEGIADPSRLAIFGWSYGGYAALQSAATAPDMFKAVVAVAPVTDLAMLRDEHRDFSDYQLIANYVGAPGTLRDASLADNAAAITAPVLLFHGTNDVNVGYRQSQRMIERLKAAGRSARLVTYPDLDHQLEDSAVRADMLRQADAFLRKSMQM